MLINVASSFMSMCLSRKKFLFRSFSSLGLSSFLRRLDVIYTSNIYLIVSIFCYHILNFQQFYSVVQIDYNCTRVKIQIKQLNIYP